jgi:hypothetical protein
VIRTAPPVTRNSPTPRGRAWCCAGTAASAPRVAAEATPVTIDALHAMIDASDPATVRGLHDRMALVLGLALMGRRWSWSPWNWTTSPRPRTGWRCAGRPRPTRRPAEWSSRSQGPGQHADTDPVRLLRAWRALLAEHGIASGRLLRSATRHDRLGASRRRCRPSVRRQGARRAAPRRHL